MADLFHSFKKEKKKNQFVTVINYAHFLNLIKMRFMQILCFHQALNAYTDWKQIVSQNKK